MGALDVGHRAGVQIEPLLAENRVPTPANEKIDNDQNPNREMIDLRVHKTLEIIQASELRLQLNSGTARSPRMLGRSISIKIRSGEWERILDQFKARFRVIRNDDFHNIEPEKNIRVVEHAQPGQSAARNAFLFLSIDGGNRPAKIFPRACLYFDEYERVVIAADNVDLAAAASLEVAVENLVAVMPQESTRQFLAVRAAPEMDRF